MQMHILLHEITLHKSLSLHCPGNLFCMVVCQTCVLRMVLAL